jgi:hypothetical protein
MFCDVLLQKDWKMKLWRSTWFRNISKAMKMKKKNEWKVFFLLEKTNILFLFEFIIY